MQNKNISSVLKSVSKPGRYIGGEFNSVIKDNGAWYAVYHGRDLVPDKRLTGDDRTARICRLELDGEKLTAVRFEDKI